MGASSARHSRVLGPIYTKKYGSYRMAPDSCFLAFMLKISLHQTIFCPPGNK
ncbi:hypothetical protein J14TS5_46860 [Paenibacillus lautus]|nr:hypothetical protein J14TS5_46860 [Paenibacillus lautus]